MLLDWRNDPGTRESSIDMGVVSEDGHRAWLDASIASGDRHLFVVEVDGKPVGTVFLGLASAAGTEVRQFAFQGDRIQSRSQATDAALNWLIDTAEAIAN